MALTSLAGNQICNTFEGVLKTCDSDQICSDGTLKQISDGCGRGTALNLSNNSLCINGTSTLAGNVTVGSGKVNITSSSGATSVCGLATLASLCVAGIATVTGEIRGCADITAFHSSDCRLKENLQPINSNNIIKGLTGYSFDWNENSDKTGKSYGVIAQDVEKVMPELIQNRLDGYKAVDYVKLIPVLIEEVKRLSNEVQELKQQINN